MQRVLSLDGTMRGCVQPFSGSMGVLSPMLSTAGVWSAQKTSKTEEEEEEEEEEEKTCHLPFKKR